MVKFGSIREVEQAKGMSATRDLKGFHNLSFLKGSSSSSGGGSGSWGGIKKVLRRGRLGHFGERVSKHSSDSSGHSLHLRSFSFRSFHAAPRGNM